MNLCAELTLAVAENQQTFLAKCSVQYFTDNLVAELVSFRQDRKLQSTRQEMDDEWKKSLAFDAVFEDSLLSAYFRRFLRIQFCEENFLFCKEVEEYKNGSYGAPKFGPPLKDGKCSWAYQMCCCVPMSPHSAC